MALKQEDQIPDNLKDAEGECLRKLNSIPTWNTEKIILFDAFEGLARAKGSYLKFTGDFRDYHLQTKGQHCLYQVPLNQRGALAAFAGKKIRLVCGGKYNLREGRYFYAKSVLSIRQDSKYPLIHHNNYELFVYEQEFKWSSNGKRIYVKRTFSDGQTLYWSGDAHLYPEADEGYAISSRAYASIKSKIYYSP